MPDITSLTGDELWSALISGKKCTVKPESDLVKLFPNYQPVVDPWKDVALVLVVLETSCTHCGSTFEQPNPMLLLERHRARDNAFHFQAVHAFANILNRCEGLPRKFKSVEQEVPFCMNCFTTIEEQELLQPQIIASEVRALHDSRLATIKAAAEKIQ